MKILQVETLEHIDRNSSPGSLSSAIEIHREVEIGEDHQFWLAYISRTVKDKPGIWYALQDPWSILLQKELLCIVGGTPAVDNNCEDIPDKLYKFAVTHKGTQLLQVIDPAMVVAKAVYSDHWELVTEWMARLSPEHLPSYLCHKAEMVRQLALARMRFINEWGEL